MENTNRETKHTPGPWKIYPPARDYDEGGEYRNLYGPDYQWVADIRSNCKEEEANARLIAAAPELLVALKRLEASTEHRNGDCYSDDYMGACVCHKELALKAIAKAEGATDAD